MNYKILKNNKNIFNNYYKNIIYINKYDIYTGKILKILKEYVIVDFGYKYEGIVYLNEIKKKKIKIGNKLKVKIIKINNYGECILSHEKAKILILWKKIEYAYNNNKILKGKIISRTKGGFIINLYKKITSFLPGSQMNIKSIKNYDYYVGKKIKVKIININYNNKNIIVSHKILIEKNIRDKKNKFISSLKVGDIVKGRVKSIISYGAFIDLGNIDGLLHIKDILYKKYDINNILKIGDYYNFVILEINKSKMRVQLGLKQYIKNTWEIYKKNIKIGKIVKCKIINITNYGAYIEIKKGINGILYSSEITWDYNYKFIKKVLRINNIIKCVIIDVNKENKKIFVSLKRLKKDPLKEDLKKYYVGSKHKGKIIKLLNNNYGYKIELRKYLYGYLLYNEISWYTNDVLNYFKIGEEIKFIITYIDFKMRRFYLSYKLLKRNEWNKYIKIYYKNSIHLGKIKNIYKNGIYLVNNKHKFLNFFMPSKLINKKYKIDELIKFKIININVKFKKIIVSPNIKVYNKNQFIKKSTFGDLTELLLIKKKLEE
ncbi:MAG: 30S ribosomal protein S1 [Flavobacteriales endosymbiont of Rhyzopertha dominica]|nr:MAG: S1 RNA-binding domain-containing protein [Candidatus Shikimatogenerans bostrichidophilus]